MARYLHTIPAKHFVQVLASNVNNEKLTDEAFREMVRNTIDIVEGGQNGTLEPVRTDGDVKAYKVTDTKSKKAT